MSSGITPGKFKVIFTDVICGAGKVKLVFERDCTPDEISRNPGVLTGNDIAIDAEPNLILTTPAVENTLQADNGNSLCSELQLRFLDTFQNVLFNFHSANCGIGSEVFDRNQDFGLLSLITEWDLPTRIATGKRTFPPAPIVISYYLNDYTNPKMKAVLESESISYNAEFIYGETVRGTLLLDNEYFEYDGAEKVLDVSAIDYIRWLLLNTSVKDGFMHNPKPAPFGGYNERIESPIGITKTIATSPSPAFTHEGTTGTIADHWIIQSFEGRNSPYKYLTIFNTGYEPDTTNRRRGMSWLGFSIADMMKRLYDRALGIWTGEADRSDWKFYCAGIDDSAFKRNINDNSSTLTYMEDANGYPPYLGNRLQNHEPADHNVVTKFRILKTDPEDEEIFLESSFSCDYIKDIIGHDSFEYSFGLMPSAWEVVTQTPGSLGYRSRYSWKNGIPHVQHFQKSLRPPLVKIPAALSIKGTPFGKPVDAVVCKPRTKFGKFHTVRRTVTSPSYSNNPMNFTTTRANVSELKEPFFDDTVITIVWDSGIDFFEVYPSKVENKQSAFRELVIDSNSDEVRFPDINPNNAFQCETCFALMGNYSVAIFGGQQSPGDIVDESAGYKNGMRPGFVYVPAGSIAEKVLGDRVEIISYSSAYPGLILYAGRDTSHNGRIIAPSTSPVGDDNDFYRGCGSIDVPYNGEYVRAYSARSALGIFNAQHHVGSGETITIVVPGIDNFENERGETGYGAIEEGFAVELFGTLYLITRVKQSSDTNETEMDVTPIPNDIPEILDESPRVVLDETTLSPTDIWDEIYELHALASDGKTDRIVHIDKNWFFLHS